jgi:hypothetical protein
MKIHEIIYETLGATSYPWKLVDRSASSNTYEFFNAQQIKYIVDLMHSTQFSELVKAKIDIARVVFRNQVSIDSSKENLHITNTGDAWGVFSTVIDIIKHAINESNFDIIVFEADKKEPSRVRLYSTFMSRVQQVLPNYIAAPAVDADWLIRYRLVKKDSPLNTPLFMSPKKKKK